MDLMKIRGAYRLKQELTKMNQRGVILMYHRVAVLEHDPWQINVTPDNFAAHMKILKKHAEPVQVRDMARGVAGFAFGKKKIVVTFDDGYADNAQNAMPILEKEGIPATFFIVSGAIDSREEFWWDELDRIMLVPKTLPDVFKMSIGGKACTWTVTPALTPGTKDYSQMTTGIPAANVALTRMDLYYVLWQLLSSLSYQEKKAALKEITAWSGQSSAPRDTHMAMTTRELQAVANCPLFEIGAHTVRHPMLSNLTAKDQEAEVKFSREDIEKIIGKKITSFSYPHGMFTDETVATLKRLKFHAACTVEQEPVTRKSDPFRLPRYGVFNWSGEQFEQQLRKWLTPVW